MQPVIFKVLSLLDGAKIYYNLEKTRPDSIRVNATLIGERLEIEVFEDDHVEISRFRGNEDIEGGMELLEFIVKSY